MLREHSENRFYFTLSTPAVGAYKRLVTGKGHKLFTGTSYDNIYRAPGTIRALEENMSADTFRREVLAKFISLKGRIWKDFKADVDWPYGNKHPTYTFDKTKPYWILGDFGSASGAYAIVQKTDSYCTSRAITTGP